MEMEGQKIKLWRLFMLHSLAETEISNPLKFHKKAIAFILGRVK